MNQLFVKLLPPLTVVGSMLHATCLPAESSAGTKVGCEVLSPVMLLNNERQNFLDIDLRDSSMSNSCQRTTQLVLFTNVVLSVTSCERMSDDDVEAGSSMLRWVLAFPAVKTDKQSVLYCAKAISEIRPVSTNEYSRELKHAYNLDLELLKGTPRRPGTLSRNRYWGPNRKALEMKWRPVFEHNRNCLDLRRQAVAALASYVASSMEPSADQGAESMFELMGRVDGFSTEEKAKIIGERATVVYLRSWSLSSNDLQLAGYDNMSSCLCRCAWCTGAASISNSADVVSYLHQFPYLGTNVTSYAECDFKAHLNAVIAVLHNEYVVTSTNALLCVADYVAEGVPLSVSNRVADVIAAHRHDRYVATGCSNLVVRGVTGNWGPMATACRHKYDLFDAYNLRLSQFKISVVREFESLLASPYLQALPQDMREALKCEFLDRLHGSGRMANGCNAL